MRPAPDLAFLLSPAPSARVSVVDAGFDVARTDYWRSASGRAGYFFASRRDAVLRLLVPSCSPALLAEFRRVAAASYQVVVTVPRRQSRLAPAVSPLVLGFVWLEGARVPYSIHLPAADVERAPTVADAGRALRVTVWVEGWDALPAKIADVPARVRAVPTLPHVLEFGR